MIEPDRLVVVLNRPVVVALAIVRGATLLVDFGIARIRRKRLPVVLMGSSYWAEIVNLEALADLGMIDRAYLDLLLRTDSVDEAYNFITG